MIRAEQHSDLLQILYFIHPYRPGSTLLADMGRSSLLDFLLSLFGEPSNKPSELQRNTSFIHPPSVRNMDSKYWLQKWVQRRSDSLHWASSAELYCFTDTATFSESSSRPVSHDQVSWGAVWGHALTLLHFLSIPNCRKSTCCSRCDAPTPSALADSEWSKKSLTHSHEFIWELSFHLHSYLEEESPLLHLSICRQAFKSI